MCRSAAVRTRFVSDKSSEGSQFKNGFGGIGGMLRSRPAQLMNSISELSNPAHQISAIRRDDEFFLLQAKKVACTCAYAVRLLTADFEVKILALSLWFWQRAEV